MHVKEKIVIDILNKLHPDRDALLKLISSQIPDAVLILIAIADVPFDIDKNLVALKSVKSNNLIPTYKEINYDALGAYLYIYKEINKQEEINLNEIYSGTYLYEELKKHGKFNLNELHLGRAYSCIILLIAGILESGYYSLQSQKRKYNLIKLIESVNYLGKNFQLALISFIACLFNNTDNFNDFFILTDEGFASKGKEIIPSFIFALIYLLLKTSFHIKENELKSLVEYLIEASKKAEEDYNYNAPWKNRNIEFLGVVDLKYDKTEYIKWIQLAKEIPSLITHLQDQELVNELNKVSALITKNEHLYKKN